MEQVESTGSIRDYGPAAPHGPNMDTDRHVATKNIHDMDPTEEGVFNSILKPDDMFDETGTYWADMNILRRVRFVSKLDGEETRRELGLIGRMIKADPLSPVAYYLRNMVIPGAGLGLEGLVTHQ
jgi:hypothetical protein